MKTKLAKLLTERLENDGFKFHRRWCNQPSDYGQINNEGFFVPNTEYVQEDWKNKEFVDFLLNADDKEISQEAEEMDKLLKEL